MLCAHCDTRPPLPLCAASGPRPLSAAAEAVAAVAAGGALGGTGSRCGSSGGSASALLGSSPPSSFSHELAYFMQSSVAATRTSLKRRVSRGIAGTSPPGPSAWSSPALGGGQGGASSGTGGAGGVPVCVHTWVRVKQPQQTRQHPLAGLWKGEHACVHTQAQAAASAWAGQRCISAWSAVLCDTEAAAACLTLTCCTKVFMGGMVPRW